MNLVSDKISVTICAFCGSEAELALYGVPLCKVCSGRTESEIQSLNVSRQIRAKLHREVLECTARAHAASEELRTIMGDIPSGLPPPDGSRRIQNAAYALGAARNEVMRAHSRLDAFLKQGVVPSDFEADPA